MVKVLSVSAKYYTVEFLPCSIYNAEITIDALGLA
jgi:hypothetical protein